MKSKHFRLFLECYYLFNIFIISYLHSFYVVLHCHSSLLAAIGLLKCLNFLISFSYSASSFSSSFYTLRRVFQTLLSERKSLSNSVSSGSVTIYREGAVAAWGSFATISALFGASGFTGTKSILESKD